VVDVVAVKSETVGLGDTLAYLFFVGINVADVADVVIAG
jgi:hypothetical protein